MQTLTPGSMLQHGSYRIEKVLGQGGFGITYLATDINLQREVAIKEFFPKDYCDRNDTTSQVSLGTQNTAEFVNRLKAKFLKEARNIAKFDYPGIIRIYSAFEENNTAYYVMEYIEGESLSAMVKRGGALPEQLALHYIDEVGKALEYVHARKINHLDVKPANIMVRHGDNTPVLIDFGLSKQYDSEGNQTSTTPTGISHGYAPIEQYTDGGVKEFSPQTDVYSLAATLYYLLSGVVPPQATRLNDEDLTFPATIPTRLIDPISKAMSPGRRHRHATVADFLAEIKDTGGQSDVTEIKQPHQATKTKRAEADKPTEPIKPVPPVQPVPPVKTPSSGGGKGKIIIIAAAVAVAVVIGAFFVLNGDNSDEPVGFESNSVTNMLWDSPLGSSLYDGDVVIETLADGTTKKVPTGKGKIKIKVGKFAGATYEGDFENGQMEGQATYTLSNGDVFTGAFHRNQFEEGKYTVKETGEYFEGSFRDMQPYKGKWCSADGTVLEELK